MRAGESRRQSPRAHESLRSNAIESLNSHQLSATLALVWPRLKVSELIIQQIVTMPIYGKEALNICHPS